MRHPLSLPTLLTFVTLFSCGGEDLPPARAELTELDDATVSTTGGTDAYTVRAGEVYGLHLGDALADHEDRLERGTLENGEGTFEVYYLRGGDGEELGYVMPSVGDATRVGDVTITSPAAATESGIRVGDPFSRLLIAHPDLSVSGSEVESRTYAFTESLAFRLEGTANTAGELDPASVPADWRIVEIVLPDAKRGMSSTITAAGQLGY